MLTVRMLENIPACSHHSVTPDDVSHTARHWHTRKTCDKLLGDLSNGDLHDLSTTPSRLQRARSSCCGAAAESQHPAKLRGCKHKSERKRRNEVQASFRIVAATCTHPCPTLHGAPISNHAVLVIVIGVLRWFKTTLFCLSAALRCVLGRKRGRNAGAKKGHSRLATCWRWCC